jgi:hypothetical protein
MLLARAFLCKTPGLAVLVQFVLGWLVLSGAVVGEIGKGVAEPTPTVDLSPL